MNFIFELREFLERIKYSFFIDVDSLFLLQKYYRYLGIFLYLCSYGKR
ncbi:hypothetical protein AsAng_0005470 [Aureispira anguillae]|uniref:Uncharacterized protein n=1 Tax=Aureispira anguillae TaxID=2864201 RepID=A0A915YB60_9BACT|nr:hypothetical protein AsAng_0005470 [Aureispira anguillae]